MSVPAKQVGGDFYDLRFQRQHAVLILGDVMGKGMAAGMLAVTTQTALRTNAIATSPSAALASAAGFLDDNLQRTSTFITLAYVHVHLVSGDYQIADAGHGLHFILRGYAQTVENVTSEGMPIGVGVGWSEKRGTLYPGDGLLLVSDGVLELRGGTFELLQIAVARCAGANRGDVQGLIEALCAGAGALSDRDDVTAVMLQRDFSPRAALPPTPALL
jgi:serine phosphatase RsbU (regulator of sigma subunit)